MSEDEQTTEDDRFRVNVRSNAARMSMAAGGLFVLLLLSLHLLEPEFDPTWRFISEYALGQVGVLMTLAFLALATSLVSAAVAIRSQTPTVLGYIGLAILAIAAIGLVIAAVFRTDPIATSQAAATTSGKMHLLGASLDYTPVAALLLSFGLARNQAWRPIRRWLFITAGITLIGMVTFILVLPPDGNFGPGVFAGLVGRLLLISYFGWLLTVGLHALKLHKQRGGLTRTSADKSSR